MASLPTIQLGDVYYLRCTHCDPPKNKYFVVAHVDPLKAFIINSDVNDFQARNADIMAAIVPMYVSEHPFMDHDSVIGCHHLSHEYQLDQLQQLVAQDPERYRGHLSSKAKDGVRQALRGNENIPVKWLKQLKVAWGV